MRASGSAQAHSRATTAYHCAAYRRSCNHTLRGRRTVNNPVVMTTRFAPLELTLVVERFSSYESDELLWFSVSWFFSAARWLIEAVVLVWRVELTQVDNDNDKERRRNWLAAYEFAHHSYTSIRHVLNVDSTKKDRFPLEGIPFSIQYILCKFLVW